MPLPIVVIIGRPNVGKSTLFNRAIKRRSAVIDPTPGVTRDRNYAEALWNGERYTLVDTGGYLPSSYSDVITEAVREQTLIAADQADLILFVFDAVSGITDIDKEIALIISKKDCPVMFVANKIDDTSQSGLAYESTLPGMNDMCPASAKTGFQFAEMLDELVNKLKEQNLLRNPKRNREELALAIIGAPNSGKSSLVNRLSGDIRMVVSDIPGTTRDSIDTIINYHGKSFRVIDTAGLVRKRWGLKGIEFYTTLRSIRALDRADVTLIMIDAMKGITQGDQRLVNQAADKGNGIIIAVNKWDVFEKDAKSADDWLKEWKRRMPTFSWVPIIFISALTGQRAIKVIEYAINVNKERNRRIPTSELNEQVGKILLRKPPPAIKGKNIKVKYLSQVSISPPHFKLFASNYSYVNKPYYRFVERVIRENYGFTGTPIKLTFGAK
ncbi:ribosome biogenesis GTPase Der [bacterium]|nr:ribosome biogenesis GTPase Der [bacterium]